MLRKRQPTSYRGDEVLPREYFCKVDGVRGVPDGAGEFPVVPRAKIRGTGFEGWVSIHAASGSPVYFEPEESVPMAVF